MKINLDSGYTDVIRDDSNPHDVAAVFKEFLRCLPDPLLTRDLYPAFLAAASKLTICFRFVIQIFVYNGFSAHGIIINCAAVA